MKIVHISISGAYTDNLSYQENYLTKYHVILGHDVYLITSEWMYDDRGNYVKAANNDYKKIFWIERKIGGNFSRYNFSSRLSKSRGSYSGRLLQEA